MEPMTMIAIGSILANVFGNLFGAKKQASTSTRTTQMQIDANNRAAELEKQALDEALAYQKEIDARDYADWLRLDERAYGDYVARDLRDRKDWEAKEQRRAPYRALGDSAIRTLADYIAVPGMRAAQEVPVQQWTPAPYQSPARPSSSASSNRPPTSNTMPVGGSAKDVTSAYLAQNPNAQPGSFKDFLPGYQKYMHDQGYTVDFMDHPTKHDKVTITGPDGRSQVVDMVVGAGGANPSWGWMVEGAATGGSAATSSTTARGGGWRNTSPTDTMLAKYGRKRPATLAGLIRA